MCFSVGCSGIRFILVVWVCGKILVIILYAVAVESLQGASKRTGYCGGSFTQHTTKQWCYGLKPNANALHHCSDVNDLKMYYNEVKHHIIFRLDD